MAVSLEKRPEPFSLRWIGGRHRGLAPQKLPIASKSVKGLVSATGLGIYRLGNFSQRSGVVLSDGNAVAYAYVRPFFGGYRKFMKKLIGTVPDDYDVDHALSQNLAAHLSYQYVLLCIVPKSVNRRHGHFEKIKPSFSKENLASGVCFADERIYHKILSRNPKARMKEEELREGYFENSVPLYGLTLKQAGLWSAAFGLHLIDDERLKRILRKL